MQSYCCIDTLSGNLSDILGEPERCIFYKLVMRITYLTMHMMVGTCKSMFHLLINYPWSDGLRNNCFMYDNNTTTSVNDRS